MVKKKSNKIEKYVEFEWLLNLNYLFQRIQYITEEN